MKFLNTVINKINKTTVGVIALSILLLAGTIGNVAAQSATGPFFNIHSGVGNGVGDESDFLRINNATGGNTAEACTDGQEVNLWFYVHNGQSSLNNGTDYTGSGVATNTVVDIDFNNSGFTNSHEIEASIGAANASTVTDTVDINCGSEQISIEYVSQNMSTNAPDWTSPYSLTGNIMNGATLGYDGGLVPGCWDYRAYITVTVKVHIEEEEVQEPVIECVGLQAITVDRTRRLLRASTPVVQNATLNGFSFSVEDKDGQEVFSADTAADVLEVTTSELAVGDYMAYLIVNTSEGSTERTDVCSAPITIDEAPEQPPEEPEVPTVPTTVTQLPRTGAGSFIALFTGVSATAAAAYRRVLNRKS